jgi:LemA protein
MTVLPVALILLVLGVVWSALAWRGLVAARDAADATWAAIDVHLKDRQALVPALIAAVQAETEIDAETLARLTSARDDAAVASTPWERADAERRLVSGIGAVSAIADHHPDLGCAAAFVDLQARLAGLDDAVNAARRVYNADVRLYRARRARFPGTLLRRLGDFTDRPYFELDHTRDRGVPTLALVRSAA